MVLHVKTWAQHVELIFCPPPLEFAGGGQFWVTQGGARGLLQAVLEDPYEVWGFEQSKGSTFPTDPT